MRGGRSFIILLAIATALGGYIYFVEAGRDTSDPSVKKARVFAGVESGKIEEIEIKAEKGDVTHLKKSGENWQITSPDGVTADGNEINSVTSTITALDVQQVLDEHPKSVTDFGLAPPRFSVAFRQTGETAMKKILVGAKTPSGSDLYAQVEGEPRVILMSSYIEDSLNKSTFSLQDKTVLKFDRTGADALTVEAPGGPAMTFARKGEAWRMTAPVDARADFGNVDGLVQQVFGAKMKAIVTPTAPAAADMKKYGLDKPQATVTVGAGSARATLAIGGKMDDTSLYARDLARPMVFTVEPALLDGLKKKPEDLRVKDAFEFRTFTALGVDLTLDGKTYTFNKVKEAPKKDDAKKDDAKKDAAATPATPATPPAPVEVWKLIKPSEKTIDQTKITDLLTDLSNVKADKFADKVVTGGTELVIVARYGDAASPKEERVTLRKSGETVHAIRAGEPGAGVITAADFDKIVKQIKDLAESK